MGQQLNIKSDDAYEMATRLTELTGESLTAAVTGALRERLEREERLRDGERRCEDVARLARELRSLIDGPVSSSDHNLLYGEDGLPA